MTAVETVDGPERFGVPYHRDTVRIGPFEKEPLDLWYLLDSASTASGCGIRVASAEWLLGALEAAGVDVRAFDRSAVRAVAQDCGVEQVQVFAGWLARAGHPGPVSAPDHRRPPVDRLLDALDQAGVVLGAYDTRLPRDLVEDHGPRSVRTVTGWIGRVGRREERSRVT